MNQDAEHLSLLAIFHSIAAGLTALLACIPFIHLAIGIALLLGGGSGPNPPPPFLGWLFVIVPGFFIGCGWTLALLIFVAGRRLKRHTAWTFCFVVAVLECFIMPYGTVLGAFTIIVLNRPPVKVLFGQPAAPPVSGPP